MSHYVGPKCRICRQEGEKLFLKGERCFTPKCAVQKKNYRPGSQASTNRKYSEYGRQLREKQKIKRIYNLTEKQLLIYYTLASRKGGDIGNEMMTLLEMRADNVLYRSGLVSSRNTARQLINHGIFNLNDKTITIPSIQLKGEDQLSLHDTKKKIKALDYQPSAQISLPHWLKADKKNKTVTVQEIAPADYINSLNLNIRLVVEFYSR